MNNVTNGLTLGLVAGTFVMCSAITKDVKHIRKDIETIHRVTLNDNGTVVLPNGTLCYYSPTSNRWHKVDITTKKGN